MRYSCGSSNPLIACQTQESQSLLCQLFSGPKTAAAREVHAGYTAKCAARTPVFSRRKIGRGGGDRTQYPTRQVIESIHPRTQIWGHLGPKGSPPSPRRYVANHPTAREQGRETGDRSEEIAASRSERVERLSDTNFRGARDASGGRRREVYSAGRYPWGTPPSR